MIGSSLTKLIWNLFKLDKCLNNWSFALFTTCHVHKFTIRPCCLLLNSKKKMTQYLQGACLHLQIAKIRKYNTSTHIILLISMCMTLNPLWFVGSTLIPWPFELLPVLIIAVEIEDPKKKKGTKMERKFRFIDRNRDNHGTPKLATITQHDQSKAHH